MGFSLGGLISKCGHGKKKGGRLKSWFVPHTIIIFIFSFLRHPHIQNSQREEGEEEGEEEEGGVRKEGQLMYSGQGAALLFRDKVSCSSG